MLKSPNKPAAEDSIFLAQGYEKGSAHDAEIFRRYYERLVNLIRPRMSSSLQRTVDADDLAQSVIWQTLRVDLDQRSVTTSNGSLWPLLAIKAIRRVYRAHRDASAQKRNEGQIQSLHAGHVDDKPGMDVASKGITAEDEAAFKELKSSVLAALKSSTDRRVFELHLAGESQEAIMNALECSQRTVNRSLQAAQEALVKGLAKWSGD